MIASSLIFAAVALLAGGDELLTNPSFETVENGKAVGWNLFVQAEPGAEGRVDEQKAFDGSRCVMLQNPDTYKTDPANNWSQNVLTPVQGKKLAIGGHIKTENAGGAALWLQCWQRDPWHMVSVASTSDLTSMSGTKDWTPVVMEVTVPDTTDFVVLRCVLKGGGKAWFDGMTVRDAEAFQRDPAPAAPTQQKAATLADSPLDPETAASALVEMQSLAETVRSLKASNASLSKQLDDMRAELHQLRYQLLHSRGPVFPDLTAEPGTLSQDGTRAYPVPRAPSTTPAYPRTQTGTGRGGLR